MSKTRLLLCTCCTKRADRNKHTQASHPTLVGSLFAKSNVKTPARCSPSFHTSSLEPHISPKVKNKLFGSHHHLGVAPTCASTLRFLTSISR